MSLDGNGSMVEPGAQVVLQRGDLVLTYAVAGPQALASIVEHPEAVAHADAHRRTGAPAHRGERRFLHSGRPARRVCARPGPMQVPFPRLRALLRAVGDASYEADEAGDVRFRLADQDGRERWLRLDEIPLPPTTPAACRARRGTLYRPGGGEGDQYARDEPPSGP